METTFFLKVGSLDTSFQPIFFFVGLLTYILNFTRINDFIIDCFTPSPEQARINQIERENEAISKFKERYKYYSTNQLENILKGRKFVPEALEATKQLLEEQKNHKNES
ncbi:MAG: hypothetical protein H7Y04_14025 [Verrucomicrobia bacterium]|nr:hypothetical protein [Cytophagales bacterium]